MKLYEFAPTRSIRARWALQELEVAFDAVSVNLIAGEHRRPEFLAINPAAKVPVLVDDGMILTESVAIVLHLADKYPEKRLMPAEACERAQALRWLLFTTTELEQPLWRMAKHNFIYPEDKRLPADIALAREEFAAMAEILDRHMTDREFVVGDRVSVADFVLSIPSIGPARPRCSTACRGWRAICCGCTTGRSPRCGSRTRSPA